MSKRPLKRSLESIRSDNLIARQPRPPARLTQIPSVLALLSSLLLAVQAYAADERIDPCELSTGDMALKRTWVSGDQTFGLFEIRIGWSKDRKPVVFAGTRENDGFHVDYPSASFTYSVFGAWEDMLVPPGTFIGPPHRLAIPFGQRAEVIASIPPAEMMEQASQWKLKLRNVDNSDCRVSLPFKVVQKRGPVEGYISDPVPEWWNKSPGEDCKCKKDD